MDWTTIATFSNSSEAEIARGLLQANDIPCYINNATISSVYPMTDTWTPLELMVPPEKADEARELLNNPPR